MLEGSGRAAFPSAAPGTARGLCPTTAHPLVGVPGACLAPVLLGHQVVSVRGFRPACMGTFFFFFFEELVGPGALNAFGILGKDRLKIL